MSRNCWVDGVHCTRDEARISVFDHGLLYGDGVFEGLRFYNGGAATSVFRFDPHLDRLEASAKAIGLTLPLAIDALREAVLQTITESGYQAGYIRLVVTRGVGDLGLDPANCGTPTVIILADQLSIVDAATRARGAALVVASIRRPPPDVLDPRIKSLNYLNQVQAKLESAAVGADEAILLNLSGHIAEGTAENLFVVTNGVLRTPPVSDGALDGITRAAVLEVARDLGIETRVESLVPYDVYTANECFLTGTGAGLMPVASLAGRAVGNNARPAFERLDQGFRDLVARETGAAAQDVAA